MKIVVLESLGISQEYLERYLNPLRKQGHSIEVYEESPTEAIQIERLKDAQALILANMPLSGEVIRASKSLKYIDIAFTGVDHVDLEAAKERGIAASNASGYSNISVSELVIDFMLALLRNTKEVEQRARQGGTKEGLVGSELHGKP